MDSKRSIQSKGGEEPPSKTSKLSTIDDKPAPRIMPARSKKRTFNFKDPKAPLKKEHEVVDKKSDEEISKSDNKDEKNSSIDQKIDSVDNDQTSLNHPEVVKGEPKSNSESSEDCKTEEPVHNDKVQVSDDLKIKEEQPSKNIEKGEPEKHPVEEKSDLSKNIDDSKDNTPTEKNEPSLNAETIQKDEHPIIPDIDDKPIDATIDNESLNNPETVAKEQLVSNENEPSKDAEPASKGEPSKFPEENSNETESIPSILMGPPPPPPPSINEPPVEVLPEPIIKNYSPVSTNLSFTTLTPIVTADTQLSSSPLPSIWSNNNRQEKKFDGRPKKDLKECIASEVMGFQPHQMVANKNPNFAKEGFIYTLEAQTSAMVRFGEDPLTYLNKDQFYGLTLEHTGSANGEVPNENFKSIVMLQFREKKTREEALGSWEFWQSRQHSPKLRLIDVDAKGSSGILSEPVELAHNAVVVNWNPSLSAAFVMISIRCLSTDFSSQKGVKGIPLHIQIDTYGENSEVRDRAFCQIKTFCDKGAERKVREEEKRLSRQCGENPNISLQSLPQSIFLTSSDLKTEPIYYSPDLHSFIEDVPGTEVNPMKDCTKQAILSKADKITPTNPSNAKESSISRNFAPNTMKNKMPLDRMVRNQRNIPYAYGTRVIIFARQENEHVFTAIHINPTNQEGFVRAICSKYEIDLNDIRYIFLQNKRGVISRIDDDMIKYYINGDVFIMKVLKSQESNGYVLYDILFVEDVNYPRQEENPNEFSKLKATA